MVLNANSLSYDNKLKKIIVKGNIIFKADDQFLEATEFEYDFIKREGFINNVYGTINFDTLSAIKDKNSINKSDVSLKKFNTIENVYLNSSSSLTFENINLNNQEEGSFGKKIISQQS